MGKKCTMYSVHSVNTEHTQLHIFNVARNANHMRAKKKRTREKCKAGGKATYRQTNEAAWPYNDFKRGRNFLHVTLWLIG